MTFKVTSRAREIAGTFLFILLFSPLIILFFSLKKLAWPSLNELVSVVFFTSLQAAASASLSLVTGFIGALGLFWIARSRLRPMLLIAEVFALAPSFIPSLLILLPLFKFAPFARGFVGIIFAHALMFSGLISVSFAAVFGNLLGGISELAWSEGADTWFFLRKVALPILRRPSAVLFLLVFNLSFVSFAIPLILGEGGSTTIEVLIYQKIWFSNTWNEAIGLSLIQMALLFIFPFLISVFSGDAGEFVLTPRTSETPFLSSPWGLLVVFLPIVFVAAGLVDSVVPGIASLKQISDGIDWDVYLLGSMMVSTFTSILIFGSLLAIAYFNPQRLAHRILQGFVAPSSALTGFAILLLWPATGFPTYFKIGIAISLIAIPSFYRMRWGGLLRSLNSQRLLADVMGASPWLVFSKIVLPQIFKPACQIAGLASIWAWGDFAISSIVAEKPVTTALLAQNLMSSYRLDSATVVIWIVFSGGLLSYVMWTGVGHVFGSRSQTDL